MNKALGTDDSVTSCDCCGKSNLKFTVISEMDNGDIAHYGQVCARRNTGKSQRDITTEIKAHKEAKIAAAREEWKAHPVAIAERARYLERPRNLVGMLAYEFVRQATEAANEVRSQLAAKHQVSFHTFL